MIIRKNKIGATILPALPRKIGVTAAKIARIIIYNPQTNKRGNALPNVPQWDLSNSGKISSRVSSKELCVMLNP